MSKTVYIVLGIGLIFFIGSVPFFVMTKPMAVSHQSYKAVPSSNEVITPRDGRLYGIAFLVIGSAFIGAFIRVCRSARRESGRGERNYGGR
jgi:hypothetical protein